MVSAIPVVALIATTVALADPATSEHHHGDSGEVASARRRPHSRRHDRSQHERFGLDRIEAVATSD